MIYRFLMLSDENDLFQREIKINADSTFRELNDHIIADLNWDKSELTTFYLADDDWQIGKEIAMMDMGMGDDYDQYLMDETPLNELIEDKGQKLLFVFDMLSERSFFIELMGIITGEDLDKAQTSISKGKAPNQFSDIDTADKRMMSSNNRYNFDGDDDMYGSEDFDMDELDPDGFGDLEDFNSSDLY